MKLIIAGSRTIEDYKILLKAVNYFKLTGIREIVSGVARGADLLGEQYGEENDIPIERFWANWNCYGKSAGYRRNKQMGHYGDALLALWDGQSKGTNHMINIMLEYRKPVWIYQTNGKTWTNDNLPSELFEL